MDEQLRRRSVGAPAARSLLLTVLGEYVLPRSGSVWQETLVGALVCLGYTQQAARQALARSTREGWLVSERHGRRTRMSLSDSTAALLRAGAERIYTFAQPWEWDRRWLVVVLRVPEEQRAVRHQLRSRLAWAGLGSLGGGVWLTPHVEREQELVGAVGEEPAAEAVSFVAQFGQIGDPEQLVAAAWDLDRVRRQYRAFIDDFSRVRATSPAAILSPADAARARLAQVPVSGPGPARDVAPGALAARSCPRACSRTATIAGSRGRGRGSRGSRPSWVWPARPA